MTIPTENDENKDDIPYSPTKTLRENPLSMNLRILKQNTFEEIDEDNEDVSTSSEDPVDDKKSKEAEDVEDTETEEIPRTWSDTLPPRRKGILRQSPYISKEDLHFDNHQYTQNKISFQEERREGRKIRVTSVDETEAANMEAIRAFYERNGTVKSQDTISKFPEIWRAMKQRERKTSATDAKSVVAIPINNKLEQSFYWLAHHHKKIGLRHMCMLVLVLTYTLLGALMFYLIESRHEREVMNLHKLNLERAIFIMAQRLEVEIADPNKLTNIREMEEFIKDTYIEMLKTEDLYSGSTFYKFDDENSNLKWTYGSALFFSMNVYTTTGYGSIAPSSTLGKVCVVFYGLLFVPLTLVVIRDLGQCALVYLTTTYIYITNSLRRARGYLDKQDPDEMVALPMRFSIAVMILYTLSATVFIYEYDKLSGPDDTGISLFHSFYFSFVSMSTIGLGDIMPNNVTFSPLITILFFFGMPLMKVVNRVTYLCLENGVFGTATVLENRLDAAWNRAKKQPDSVSAKSSIHKMSTSDMFGGEEVQQTQTAPNDYLTIRSIATFIKANGDVYKGGFGRVNIRRGDLVKQDSQNQNQNVP